MVSPMMTGPETSGAERRTKRCDGILMPLSLSLYIFIPSMTPSPMYTQLVAS